MDVLLLRDEDRAVVHVDVLNGEPGAPMSIDIVTIEPHPQIRVTPAVHPMNHAPVAYDGGRVLLETAGAFLADRIGEREAAAEILYVLNEWARWRQEFEASNPPGKPDA